jgi:hypothetical protein
VPKPGFGTIKPYSGVTISLSSTTEPCFIAIELCLITTKPYFGEAKPCFIVTKPYFGRAKPYFVAIAQTIVKFINGARR